MAGEICRAMPNYPHTIVKTPSAHETQQSKNPPEETYKSADII